METKEILQNYLNDMLGTEKHTLESIERQVTDERVKGCREAFDLILKTQSILNSHVRALEQYLSSTEGMSESMIKKAATATMGTVSGWYSKVRSDEPVSRDLRDNYGALSVAAISYTMLHTSAEALKEFEVAEMALRHLNEITPLIAAISRVIPVVVAKELRDAGKAVDATVGPHAAASTQKAWSRDVIGTA